MRQARLLAVPLFLLMGLLAPGRAPVRAADPPYSDVFRWDWFYNYVEVLRQEEITDGYYGWIWNSRGMIYVCYYSPSSSATRAEYVLMMAKAFRLQPLPDGRLPFSDVPPGLLLYDRIPARPWLAAAHRAGFVTGRDDGRFYPQSPVRRDEAVAVLVRALGLADFAAGLSAEETARLLAPFRDRGLVERSLVPEIALAVKLRILLGYPDGTLRPANYLRRSEAAAVLYRSTLFQLQAAPNPFTPDGDGVGDETTFTARTLKNRSLVRWQAFVGTLAGQPLRTFNRGGSSRPPANWTWDGRDDHGLRLPPGTYYYWGWARDQAGNEFTAPMKPLVLEERTLSASASPAVVEPGGTVTLRALTAGRATAVTASAPGGERVALTPAEPVSAYANTWTATLPVPLDAQSGVRSLTVTAAFPETARSVPVTFEIRPSISLAPGLDPNPAVAGGRVTATARTSPNVRRVRVRWPWQAEQDLTPDGRGGWRAEAVIPPDFPAAAHPVTFTARAPQGSREVTLTLMVRASGLQSVEFVLTD